MLKTIADDLGYGRAALREKPMATHIPYTRLLSDNVVGLSNGSIAIVIKMDGLFFQTLDQSTLNMRASVQNTLARALGSSRYALWSTIIRREVVPEIGGEFHNPFNDQLNKRYMAQLREKRTFVNELFLTVILKNLSGILGFGSFMAKMGRVIGGKDEQTEFTRQSIVQLTDSANAIVKDLQLYGARLLGVRRDDKNEPYSEVCEYFDCILNMGKPRSMRLPRMPIKSFVGQARLHFARKIVMLDGSVPAENRFGAILSIKEYPPFSGPGLLNDLLVCNHEFILSQSFRLADKPIAQERIQRLQRQIGNSDEAGTKVETDIDFAINGLLNQETVFGYHHLTLLPITRDLASLDKAIAELGSKLNDMNINYLREDFNMEAAFWAQLPGNFAYIARDAMMSSANFAGFSSFHNFALGQRENLHWKTPISVLETTSQTPYYFNFHTQDIGHFLVTGPTGSGKTVAMTFLLSQAFRISPEPKAVFFDKDRGAEIFIRAMSGSYEILDPDRPTGFNPLQIANTESNREFLLRLIKSMLRKGLNDIFRESEEKQIAGALVTIMNQPKEMRNLAGLRSLLKGSERANDDDLHARMRPWVEGEKAWLFNAPIDMLTLSDKRVFGFDMTKILDNEDVRTPALMYLFHRMDELLTGEPVMMFMDEGWKLLADDTFARFIQDKLKTIRKLNGIVGFGTQSAADITQAKQARTLIEQASVNIHFPNAKADEESYMKAFGLTRKEFNIVKRTPPERRQFLIKRGNESVVARLDLGGMPDLVKVLSGRKETVEEMDRLIAEHGENPADWLPVFCGWENGK